MKVLIVGAGAAGLMAAYTLKRAGVKFQVIEASSRIGGRIKKLDKGFASFPLDLGAEWIHTSPLILKRLVLDPTTRVNVETVRYTADYSEWDGKKFERSFYLRNDHKFVDTTWFDFFNDYIAPPVKQSIEFNCPVSNIDWSSPAVKVTCQNGKSFQGTHVIVTVPIRILQDGDIQFKPNLPSNVQKAYNSIWMPPGFKVFLKFRKRFYPESFAIASDFQNLKFEDSERFFFDQTFGHNSPSTEHILSVETFGELATDLSKLNDTSLLNHTLSVLDGIFKGDATANFMEGIVQNWANEPYARGCYSFYNDTWPQIDILRQPLQGRLFLAGEAIPAKGTNYQNGFAHGAALSGREAARLAIICNGRLSGLLC